MKTIKYLLFFSITIVFISCSRNLAPQGHYQSSPVIADGNANDWQLPLRFANKDYSYTYNITNDKKNIYIIIMSKDEYKEQQILKSGVTIYFDPKGETNKKISLTYPERKSNNYTKTGTLTRYNTNDSSNSMKILVVQSDTYNAQGFMNLENGQYGIKDKKSKIQVALKASIDSGLVYEAVIPINYVLENGLDDKRLKKNFTIGIVVHENSISQTRNNNNNNAGNRSSGIQPRVSVGGGIGGFGMMGGRMGMGMGVGGGGMRGGRNNNQQQNNKAAEEETVWYQFRFTTQAN